MGKQKKRLWETVKRLILENYEVLTNKRSIRGSWYIVGDLLAPLIGKDITVEDYHYFGDKQAYNIYRDDIWTWIEQKHGLERPEASPVGVVYDDGVEYPIKRLENAWDQARGFIFVEKADEAKALKPLSKYGWTICAGKGYPTRLVRKLLKEDTRLVLVLHDWDRDGQGIYEALGFETRRTKHLDIALGERVIDLGLTEEHVKALDLPTRPSPPKYGNRPRAELSALEVLAVRLNIDNPVLAYAVASMMAKGLMLSPTEVSKKEMLARHLRWALTDGLSGVVSEVVKDFMGDMEEEEIIEGEAVNGVLKTMEIASENISEALRETAENLVENLTWKSEAEVHREAVEKFTNDKLSSLLNPKDGR